MAEAATKILDKTKTECVLGIPHKKRVICDKCHIDFISFALGGPNQYTGLSMKKVHEGMNIKHEHFMAIVNHLAASLKQFNVSDEDIQAIAQKLMPMEKEIVEA